MFSDKYVIYALVLMLPVILFSCSPLRQYAAIAGRPDQLVLTLPEEDRVPMPEEDPADFTVDSSRAADDAPLIMNAIRDSETGEMTATDVISASKVVARFRNIAERAGSISLSFDVTVPEDLISSEFQLRFSPELEMMGDTLSLEPVFITGENYRKRQLKGYERYRAFLESIITDSTLFIRRDLLETFLARYFPETFAMKNDSSIVPDPMAENLFGVNQKLALEHYTMQIRKKRNAWKMENKDAFFRKYVKAPFADNVRLDTVMASGDGSLVYRYSHTMQSAPGLRKLTVNLHGTVFMEGEQVLEMPSPEKLTFYISSLSSLADNTPRFLFRIVERTVTDNTDAFLDFEKGSTDLDTLKAGNASELGRIRKCFTDIYSRKDMVLDSIIVTASCSPEGRLDFNARLAEGRAQSVKKYVLDRVEGLEENLVRSESVPENWKYFRTLVANDTLLEQASRQKILSLAAEDDKDLAESCLASMPEYRYLREKIYPRLRTVSFNFFMHRPGVLKDTIHTKVLDTVYMKGLDALKNLDYKTAAAMLGPYRDYNAALALASSGYDDTALSVLSELDAPDAKADYLGAVLLARTGRQDLAEEYFMRSVRKDPSMVHRANLDPELSDIVKKTGREYGQLP